MPVPVLPLLLQQALYQQNPLLPACKLVSPVCVFFIFFSACAFRQRGAHVCACFARVSERATVRTPFGAHLRTSFAFHLAPANFHLRSHTAMPRRFTLGLLVWSCGLLVQNCAGQEGECQCNLSHGRCDESGVCRCDPGWEGPQCDDCARMPGCVHGSCHQPWQCTCENGWAGRFCDKDVLVCTNEQPCQNGATCFTNDSGDYSCFCPEGFHGRNCELKTGPCQRARLCRHREDPLKHPAG